MRRTYSGNLFYSGELSVAKGPRVLASDIVLQVDGSHENTWRVYPTEPCERHHLIRYEDVVFAIGSKFPQYYTLDCQNSKVGYLEKGRTVHYLFAGSDIVIHPGQSISQ